MYCSCNWVIVFTLQMLFLNVRSAYALWKMGPAVVNGATSTFISVFPANFAASYVFKAFFRMFFLITVFGVWFGGFFIPVVLSLIGPRAYSHAPDLKDHPDWNPLDPDHDKAATDSDESSDEEDAVPKVVSTSEPIAGEHDFVG
eukprot:TRINITY_DN6883_c0_g2_i1.p1 TRINITY_DN6883_c0_g2~~TRINITY_DN6883_c0_g2_i1.p1  ORF type:complete len:144 (+),score=19.29 TRINITY_DN6883_c0_g2_i1:933-1364(+)